MTLCSVIYNVYSTVVAMRGAEEAGLGLDPVSDLGPVSDLRYWLCTWGQAVCKA